MGLWRKRFLNLILLGFFIIIHSSHSKTVVLLVGIDNYSQVQPLNGAVNDAKAIKNLFQKLYPENVYFYEIYNEKATKRNILRSLKEISQRLTAGDRFYFFYSGHGTSYADYEIRPLFKRLDQIKYGDFLKRFEYSGALVPYDFIKKPPEKAVETLIVGFRDLKPILKTLDTKGVKTVVVFDACFSGLTVRSLPIFGKIKRILLPDTVKKLLEEENKPPPYSYRNVVYLSSSTQLEFSLEREGRGVFSFFLEEALKGKADFDKDFIITKKELEKYFELFAYKINSTPVLYPFNRLSNYDIFKLKKPNVYKIKSDKIRIYLSNVPQTGFSKGFFKEFIVVDNKDEAMFIVERDKDNGYKLVFNFYSTEGLITKFDAIKKIENYLKSFKIFSIFSPKNRWVEVSLVLDGGITKQLKAGREGIIKADFRSKGFFFLFTINKEGKVFLIEPIDSPFMVDDDTTVEIPVVAEPPVGIEFVKAFIIKDKKTARDIFRIIKSQGLDTSSYLKTDVLEKITDILQKNRKNIGENLYPIITYQ